MRWVFRREAVSQLDSGKKPRAKRVGFGVLVGLILALWPLGLFAAAPNEAEVGAGEKRLNELEHRLSELRGRYVNPLLAQSHDVFQVRYDRARGLYVAQDYVYASIILTDLLQTADVEKRPQYREMLWLLGDSFAHTNNYVAAREYLQKVISGGSGDEHYRDALVRLIEISVELERFDDAKKCYEALSRAGGGEGLDLIQYGYAKSLHKKGSLPEALKIFEEIKESSPKYSAARYFAGVILVEQLKLDEALGFFKEVTDRETGADAKSRALHELSILAAARVLFEEKKFDEAQSLYRKVPLESKFFDQAYYELSWIFIQKEKYQEAANTLDILLLAIPDSIYAPQSQVLKGNIQLLQGRFKEADYSFQLVINKYAQVVETMDRILAESEGRKAEEIQAHVVGDQTTLPPVAIKWLSEAEDVRQALKLTSDIQVSEADTTRGRRVIQALRVHLDQNSRANIFPELKIGNERGAELEHDATQLSERLVQASGDLLAPFVPEADRARLVELQKKRRELSALYGQLPKTVQERYERRQRQLNKVTEMEKKVFQLSMQLKSVEQLLTTISARYEQLRGDPNTSASFMAEAKRDVADVMSIANELNAQVATMQNEVALWVERTKIGDDSQNRDQAIRVELERLMTEETLLVVKLRGALPAEQVAFFDRLEASKRRCDSLQAGVASYRSSLDALVVGQVEGFNRDVAVIETELADYESNLTALKKNASKLADLIAYRNLQDVKKRFHEVVLKANVGQVDIAWERRQLIRKKIDELLQARAEEKRQLNSSFQELRGE